MAGGAARSSGGGKRPQFRNANLNLAAWLPSRLAAKKAAFTLAEVLITLGIIGVVAAVTLPTLVANYQKTVWVNQLKKDVNFTLNTFQQVFASEEVDSISNSSLYYSMGYPSASRFQATSIKKYIVDSESAENTDFFEFAHAYGASTDSNDPSIFLKLKDGSCIAFATGEVNTVDVPVNPVRIFVDVNCSKRPNEVGRDRFWFDINNYGKIYMPSEYSCSIVSSDDLKELIGEDLGGLSQEDIDALRDWIAGGCFYKIVSDGWKMNY